MKRIRLVWNLFKYVFILLIHCFCIYLLCAKAAGCCSCLCLPRQGFHVLQKMKFWHLVLPCYACMCVFCEYVIHDIFMRVWALDCMYAFVRESVCPAYCIYLPLTTIPPGSCSNSTEWLPPLPSRPSTCDSIIPKPCSTARIQIQIHKLMFLIGTIFYSIACVISSNCVSSSVFVLSWLVTCCIRLTCVIHARLEHDSRRIPQPWFFAVCCCFRERRPEMSAPPPLISLQDDISIDILSIVLLLSLSLFHAYEDRIGHLSHTI